jgi:hypothetical protein
MRVFYNWKFVFLVFLCSTTGWSQTDFYDDATVQQLELFFSQSDWDYQLDTAKAGQGGFIFADSVRINGITFDSVGVKYKGNSSYDATFVKNPFHIELNSVFDQYYQGYSTIKLSNGYGDPSLVREVTAFQLLNNYMDAPKCNFAKLYVNNVFIGVYSNTESIDKTFCATHFYSSNHSFFKCNPTVIPSPTTKSNLRYLGADSTAYFNYYELKSNLGWTDLLNACNVISNNTASIESVIDLDRAIWMLAFNNVIVNLDSYSGVFAQNYYLYQDDDSRFDPVIWDLNMSFGGFPYVGSGNSSMGSLTVSNMQQLPLTIHSSDTYWPLIKAVMANPMYKRMYIAHVRTIVDEFVSNNGVENLASNYQTLIDNAVLADTNAFFSYSDFQSSLTTDLPFGSYTVPGISNLMNNRLSYYNGTAEFQLVPPSISSVTCSNNSPAIGTTFYVLATVTTASANGVYLGYRDNLANKFTRIQMFDDGLHGDGAAGDNSYGVAVTMSAPFMHYYVYAENASAGVFSPRRAEHEYYFIGSTIVTPTSGQVAINEFVAINQNGAQNEYAKSNDWIELYNTTTSSLSLYGLYLSDDPTNLMKFAFPENTSIAGNGYLAIWADEDSTSTYLHANFKLSGNGEHVLLSDYMGNILDSLSYGPQTADVSVARCPDGIGSFDTTSAVTFLTSNCVLGISNETPHYLKIYPNPTTNQLAIQTSLVTSETYQIWDVLGNVIAEGTLQGLVTSIDVQSLKSGIYWVKIAGFSPTPWCKE